MVDKVVLGLYTSLILPLCAEYKLISAEMFRSRLGTYQEKKRGTCQLKCAHDPGGLALCEPKWINQRGHCGEQRCIDERVQKLCQTKDEEERVSPGTGESDHSNNYQRIGHGERSQYSVSRNWGSVRRLKKSVWRSPIFILWISLISQGSWSPRLCKLWRGVNLIGRWAYVGSPWEVAYAANTHFRNILLWKYFYYIFYMNDLVLPCLFSLKYPFLAKFVVKTNKSIQEIGF